jgi:hypothetical protein
MLVDFEPLRLIDDRGHLDRRFAVHEPGPERCAVAEIVEQAAAAGGLAVPPRGRLLAPHLLVRHDDLVGAMIERTAVAVVKVNLDHVADNPLVDQPLGRHMRRIPAQRPIDGEPDPRLLDGRKDAIGVGKRGGERLFEQDVDSERGDLLDQIRMPGGGRTEDGKIRTRLSHALRDVSINALPGNGEVGDGVRHPRLVVVAHPGDLGVRMLVGLAQKVAHVHMFEAQADDPPFAHLRSSRKARAACADQSSVGSGLRWTPPDATRLDKSLAGEAAALRRCSTRSTSPIATASVAESDLNPEKLSSITSI